MGKQWMRLKKILVCFLTVSLCFGSSFLPLSNAEAKLAGSIRTGEMMSSTKAAPDASDADEREKTEGYQGKYGTSQILARVAKDSFRSSFYGRKETQWVNLEGKAEELPKREKKPSFLAYSSKELPASFDLRKESEQGKQRLSTVKNQGGYGLCWAAAGLSAVESNLLTKGLSYRQTWLSGKELQLSMAHLGWYLFSEPAKGERTEGDYLGKPYRGAEGGDYTMTIASLAAGVGTQLEKNAPYENWHYGQAEAARYVSYYGLSDADYLDFAMTQEARKTVKQWILERGAVEAGFYFSKQEKEECYYQETYPAAYGNHEIVLVGWDDGYSRENFRENGAVPEYDGAWLAQNSYGTEWGEDGYFYLSYEEPSLAGFISYQMEERKDGEKCYQYDGIGGNLGVASTAFSAAANVFTAEESETLTEIGISLSELNSSGADYSLNIYKWKNASLISKKSMVNTGDLEQEKKPLISEDTCVKEAETKGQMEYPGYHKIALKTPVSLQEGESFAVVLKLSPIDGRSAVYYSFEGSIRGYDMEEYHYGCKKGQTYFLKGYGSQAEWEDVTGITEEADGYALGNLNLKAFTFSEDRAGEESTLFQEQKAELSETIAMAERFLEAENADADKASFTDGNESCNEKLRDFLKKVCGFSRETLELAEPKIYELENAYDSLAAAMEYMKYPAEKSIQTAEELYQLSEQTKSLSINALSLVSIQKDLSMNPASAFTFGRFDTEQPKGEKGVIQKIEDGKVKNFSPIGGNHGVEFILEGNGHSISGLVCHAGAGEYSGLMGNLTGNGCIRNLTIKDSYLEGNFGTGAFAGVLGYGGTIQNCRIKNTFVRGKDAYDENGIRILPCYTGGLAGLVSYGTQEKRTGVYDSGIQQSLVYGGYCTGGLMGAVSSGAFFGTGNAIKNSSVVGIAAEYGISSGVGMYLGGSFGGTRDGKQQEIPEQYGMVVNGSDKKRDALLVNLYQPKKASGKGLLLFLEPYDKENRVLEHIILYGEARKKKRGKDAFLDGWQIGSMKEKLMAVPVTKRSCRVNFYSSLTGKQIAEQRIVRGRKAVFVKYPKLSGYQFLGWYDKISGEKFRFGAKVTKDYELYPLYKKSK